MTDTQLWTIIFALGIGSFFLRFSFLGLIGDRPMPAWLLRHLRYTAVAIIPALVAPLVVWSDGPGTPVDPAQMISGAVAILFGVLTRSTFPAMIAGAVSIAAFYIWM